MSTIDYKKALERAEDVTGLAFSDTNNTSGRIEFENDGRIKQTERLFTARPRYAPLATNASDLYQKASLTRGTHAYIKLLTSTSQATKYSSTRGAREGDDLTGPGSIVSRMVSNDSASGYDAFMITSVSCQMQEKLQITEVFGDGEVAYYFGHQPVMFNIGGLLVDSPDNSWFTNWLRMYSSVMRGSQLAQNHELIRLVLPNMVLVGTISSMSWSQDASNDVTIPFQFQFLAKRIEPTAPILENVTADQLGGLIDFGKASSFITQQQINSFKSQFANLENIIKNPSSTVAQIGSALSGLGLGSGGSLGSFGSTLSGIATDVKDFVVNNEFSQGLSSTASLFKTISANLNGIRTQLFSPIYGVLTSLTKLVRNTAGNINTIFNSLFKPVQNILRDITNISNQAVALVNLVNNSIRGIGRNVNRQLGLTKDQFNTAMKAVGKASGAIATSPQTVLQSLQSMFSSGAVSSSAAFLQENRKASLSGGSRVNGGSSRLNYKIAILQGQPVYTATAGANL